jgi:hypothetical protein
MRRRSLGPLRMSTLAGWLFADLFLVLFVVGLASLPPTPRIRPPTPRPTPTPTPRQVLDRSPVSFVVNVAPASLENPFTRPAAASELIRKVDQELAARHLQGRRAGFVLVFASGPTSAIGLSVQIANSVVRIVRSRDTVFSGAGGAGYWNGAGNAVKFKIFFFAKS